ncbi:MAG: VanW family protein [Candidatus Peribacteraceae bacterium]|jgi:vancomycin resistance protein YoaR
MKHVVRIMGIVACVFLLRSMSGLLSVTNRLVFKPSAAVAQAVVNTISESGSTMSIDADLQRVSSRLGDRIKRTYGQDIPLPRIAQAITERRHLLSRSLQLTLQTDDGTMTGGVLSPARSPLWIQADISRTNLSFRLDPSSMKEDLAALLTPLLPRPQDSTISAVTDDDGIQRVTADQPAKPGFAWDAGEATTSVRSMLLSTGSTLTLAVPRADGRIINQTGLKLGDLQLLATGRSNFQGSGGGRISNVRKGLSEYVNGVMIPAGATVSFNDVVGNMGGSGWQNALVIMNGKDLVSFPGGGICQVATTVYRAVLNAGLPVLERANHSLYVTYYEKYGVGIDATVFPYKQDLSFVNDTGHPLLMQAYSDGFEASVHFYGTSDGRVIALNGPYFQGTESAELRSQLGRSLSVNEIAWLHSVTSAAGVERNDIVLSRYLAIPRQLRKEYASL